MRPGVWHERAQLGPRTGWFWDPLGAQHVARYLWARSVVESGSILDVACGTGYGSALLAGPGRRVLGIDVSAEAVALATRDFASVGVTFVVGDATRLPVEAASVDFVVSFETIEHLAEPAEFIAEVARVLRPGGTLLLSTPDRSVYSRGRSDGRSDNPFHPSEMTRPELLTLLEARLIVREVGGQCVAGGNVARAGAGPQAHPTGVIRSVAKNAVRAATGPFVRNDALARWLFPHLRQRYVPVTSGSGDYMYTVVRAEKP
jgi:SAM-dependent methyltransferase